ncbi:hypothetical protein NF552_22550 (plasmid) [Roseomonas mucosa]|nr:hypothetical protein NF552_22550 [Roseomonas mucosa]
MHVDRVARLRPQPYPVSTALAAAGHPATSDPAPRGKSDIPKVPEAVARVIEAGVLERRLLFPESGGSRVVERWQPVAVRRDDVLEEVRAHLADLEAALQPADRGALLARLLALLSHYRAEPNPPQVEQMMADDWAEDLGEFPMWAIEDACKVWRRTRKWKPQIVEVLALCRDAVGDAAQRRDRLRAVADASTAARNPLSERMRMVAATTFRRVPS